VTRKAIAAVLVTLVVAVCAWPLAAFSMKHYLPEVDNDELMNFLLVKTFRTQGFHIGYAFTNDHVPAGPIHFSIQGPGTVLLYSQLARLVGWTNYSPYLANLLVFIPSWLLLSYALRRHPQRRIAAAVFVLAHGYFFMFLPSMMQESFHLSVAIAMAALWLMAIEGESPAAWAALLALTAAAMLVRYSWAVVLPCFLFSFVMQRTAAWPVGRRLLASVLVSVAGGAVVTAIAVRLVIGWALPPNSVSSSAFSVPPIAFGFSASRLAVNLSAVARLKSIGMFGDYPRYFLGGLITTLAVFLAVGLCATRDRDAREAARWGFVILGAAFSAQILFYTVDGWRDFRILLPAHAFAGLMFCSRVDLSWERWPVASRVAAVIALSLVMAVNAVWSVRALKRGYLSNWTGNIVAIDDAGRRDFARLAPFLDVSRGDSAFCKTVYANDDLWGDARLAYMPDAFAVSAIAQERGRVPVLRGKYALIRATAPADPFNWVRELSASRDWRMVAEVDDLTLFRSTMNCLSSS
jgi:hypothetical protein